MPDDLWERIEPLLPKRERRFRYPGRKPVPDRQVLCGILFVLHTGVPWEHLPQELGFGSIMTCRRRLRDRVRFIPHHDHHIEVCHAAAGRYLGPADLADQATEEQLRAVRRARAARSRRLKKDLEASQRQRYAAATQAEPPRQLGALTRAQVDAELAQSADVGLSQLALPDVVPPAAPPADWRTPPSPAALTTPPRSAPCSSGRDSTATAPDSPDGRAVRPTTDDEDGDAS